MGFKEQTIILSGLNLEHRYKALFDSGSSHSWIKSYIIDKIKPLKITNIASLKIETAKKDVFIYADKIYLYNVIISGKSLPFEFLSSDEISEQVILGIDFMQQFDYILNFGQERITVSYSKLKRFGKFRI